ncbi:MAG: hypothetical protein AB8G99_15295 [Planctomycetaceae bacterium]
MGIVEWVRERRPGQVIEHEDRFELRHDCGEVSTFWRGTSATISGILPANSPVDGMDLFSSTFKVAASVPRMLGGVKILFSFDELAAELRGSSSPFTSSCVPFMYQAGIGYYALSDGKIQEWDTMEEEVTGTYALLIDVVAEWLAAVGSE